MIYTQRVAGAGLNIKLALLYKRMVQYVGGGGCNRIGLDNDYRSKRGKILSVILISMFSFCFF